MNLRRIVTATAVFRCFFKIARDLSHCGVGSIICVQREIGLIAGSFVWLHMLVTLRVFAQRVLQAAIAPRFASMRERYTS
ncbi:hypothetical protein M3O58_09075 [Xanthomonas nasturtii]|uniref:hypothetical protein n=1 Tax=Xanthomonas nasturtii TaxID=1843581 RepID=UPI0011C07B25|nr:hypothetical protein [Xanthomonas nasturtii]MCL1529452.1 hypothetical protein [Xanthomonas nasturtii]MCL1535280.1 hypothetical protein [Xanthomonas nasturtii]MCL1564380.1 hypothetical protein [Xanthomonas nasturtii]MCL1567560.1 hypothetical protein [Xanthomonas nasturtii]MCL1579374.1 hypothetical protein [Xanthomonas nasturtii]